MAPKIISSDAAWGNRNDNAFANWPSRTGDDNRIEPICKPGLQPQFKIHPGDKIYTTGSCFARNVEDALASRGFNVVNLDVMKLGPEFTQMRRGILNNYGIPSMFNELDWALNPQSPFDERHFFEVGRGRYIDVHLNTRIRPAALDIVRARRQAIIDAARRVVECSTIIMTLGLVETWYDKETKRYLNYTPPRSITEKYPNRFQLHVLDFKTAMHYVRAIVDLLKTHCMPEHKILLTVSPVPLISTFTSQDVVIANTYSKSLLRVVADAVVTENKHIDYFPSYESVTLSDRKLAWRDDMHHVEDRVVAINVGRMMHAYTDADERSEHSVHEAISEARSHWQARDPRSALRCLEPVADQLESVQDRLFLAEMYRGAGRKEEALRTALALPPGGAGGTLLSKAVLFLNLGAIPQALETAKAVLEGSPGPAVAVPALRVLVKALMAQERYDEAIDAARKWADLTPSRLDALRALADIYRAQGKYDGARQVYLTAMERDPDEEGVRLDYAEFLIAQAEIDEARNVLTSTESQTPGGELRLRKLSLFAAA